MIGQLEVETKARTFSNYLYVQGIDNQIEAEKDGSWAVWIHAEEELDRARVMLAEYRGNPDDPKYRITARAADGLKEQKRKEQAEYEKRVKQRRNLFRPMTGYGFGPVTFLLILISVGVYLIHQVAFRGDDTAVMKLFMTNFSVNGSYVEWHRGLLEIRHGEIWRLVTPIFLHFSILHIVLNVLWLRDLGSMIEGRQNSVLFLVMTLVLAVGSNLAQYFYGGPMFGGLSGVVYGLLGYIWIRGKLDPGSGLFVQPSTVVMMIIWFFFCFTPWAGAIANGAHTAGLLMGMAWGWLSSLRHR
jgi:GlpG protein